MCDRLPRRRFLQSLARAAAAGAGSCAWATDILADQARVAPPKNLRQVSAPSLKDLTWRGMCEPPAAGFSHNEGQLAVRYVGGERRLLMCRWHNKDGNHGTAGNLVEFRMPAVLSTSAARAAYLAPVAEWENWHWEPDAVLAPKLANGWLIGGMWWDELQQVLWYTLYPYYAPGVAMPFLAAVQLHEGGRVTKFGPWFYVDETSVGFRKVCWYFVTIPQRFQALLGGRRVALGANTLGASGGSATNWGPGLTAIRLPELTSTDPVEAGVSLMDYSPGAGGLAHPWFHCQREPDYRSLAASTALPLVTGSTGFWQASADMAIPAAWLDSGRRSGLLLIGHRTTADTWYGLAAARNIHDTAGNVIRRDPVDPPDLMAVDQGSTGYHSNGWQSAAWVVRNEHLEEVARGHRKPSADGMRPELLGQWHTRWTEIQRPSKRPYVDAEGMVVDTVTNELVWSHGRSKVVGCCAVIPTVQVLSLPS